MLQHEFESLAGYKVSDNDYKNYIEPMYMALPESVTKDVFVTMINKKRFALPTKQQMKKQMREITKHLYEICGRYHDWHSEEELLKIGRHYAKQFYDLDWNNDMDCYVYIDKEYEFPHLKRGCTYPVKLVIGRKSTIYEEIELVKGERIV